MAMGSVRDNICKHPAVRVLKKYTVCLAITCASEKVRVFVSTEESDCVSALPAPASNHGVLLLRIEAITSVNVSCSVIKIVGIVFSARTDNDGLVDGMSACARGSGLRDDGRSRRAIIHRCECGFGST